MHHDDRITKDDGGGPSDYTQPAGCLTGHRYNSATRSEILMARKKTTPGPQHVEAEAETQDSEAMQGGGQKGHGFAPGSSRKMSKTDAIRAAMAEGIESPGDGVDFIRRRFGIEMSKGHFSATKSKLKSAEAVGATKGGARKSTPTQNAPKAAMKPQPVERHQPERLSGGEGGLLSAMETMKPLVERMGKDQVKRIVDILG